MDHNRTGLFAAILTLATLLGGTTAQASFYGDFPDAIRCDITDNPSLGSAIFVINSRNQAGLTVYRHIAFTSNTDYNFNSNGTFNSKNFPRTPPIATTRPSLTS